MMVGVQGQVNCRGRCWNSEGARLFETVPHNQPPSHRHLLVNTPRIHSSLSHVAVRPKHTAAKPRPATLLTRAGECSSGRESRT
eukprot:3351044-Rhodomonas_salina.2